MTDLTATPEEGPVTTDDYAASLLAPVEEPATEDAPEEAPLEVAEAEEAQRMRVPTSRWKRPTN